MTPALCSVDELVLYDPTDHLLPLLSSARYMSAAVVHDGTERVLLALGCSDGAVRWVSGLTQSGGGAKKTLSTVLHFN